MDNYTNKNPFVSSELPLNTTIVCIPRNMIGSIHQSKMFTVITSIDYDVKNKVYRHMFGHLSNDYVINEDGTDIFTISSDKAYNKLIIRNSNIFELVSTEHGIVIYSNEAKEKPVGNNIPIVSEKIVCSHYKKYKTCVGCSVEKFSDNSSISEDELTGCPYCQDVEDNQCSDNCFKNINSGEYSDTYQPQQNSSIEYSGYQSTTLTDHAIYLDGVDDKTKIFVESINHSNDNTLKTKQTSDNTTKKTTTHSIKPFDFKQIASDDDNFYDD